MIKKIVRWRYRLTENKLSLTGTKCMGQTLSVTKKTSGTDTDCLCQTHTVCNRHLLSLTDKDFRWQTKTICAGNRLFFDRHILFVTDTYCLWQIKLLMTYRDCLSRHRRSVTDTDYLWQTVCWGAKEVKANLFGVQIWENLFILSSQISFVSHPNIKTVHSLNLWMAHIDCNKTQNFRSWVIKAKTAIRSSQTHVKMKVS